MIHLLIVTPSHSLHGGVERIIESLAHGLPGHGFRVTVGLAAGARWHLPDRYRQEYPEPKALDIVPRLSFASSGRLGRWLGERSADRVRAIMGRRPALKGPGDEWPHWGGAASADELEAIRAYGASFEAAQGDTANGGR